MRTRRALQIIGFGTLAALLLNVGGLWRYPGGPLIAGRTNGDAGPLWIQVIPSDRGSGGWSIPLETGIEAGDPIWDAQFAIRNRGPWPVTIERITPLWTTGTAELDGEYLARMDVVTRGMAGGTDPTLMLGGASVDEALVRLPAVVEPGTEKDPLVIIVFHATQAGLTAFQGIRVDYAVGVFKFTMVEPVGGQVCIGPLDATMTCWPE